MARYVWVVCYVDITKIDTIEKNLAKKYNKYKKVEAYVPTMKVLTKTFRKENHYKDVPLLFNYGFFKVPEYFIYNSEFLREMKSDIDCIYQWLTDHTKEHLKKVKRKKVPTIATARPEEIEALIEASKQFNTYSKEQVDQLKVGQVVTLRTYPFENVMVRIKEIDTKRKQVEVELVSDMNINHSLKISFDHIFYTIYHDNNLVTGIKEQSLDELIDNGFPINDIQQYEWY